jgi:pyruvate dehydrogenase E1 component
MIPEQRMTTANDSQSHDIDPQETIEWLDALSAVINVDGSQRAHFLLEQLVDLARRSGGNLPYKATTAYVNTIPPNLETRSDGDHGLEAKIRSIVRWNAMAIVVRANRVDSSVGGHISTFASSATLYDVGFNHFFQAPTENHGGDLLYMQGHNAPGFYARAYLEGRLTEAQMNNFRREVEPGGLSSYPHPWLMPEFWQLPTVSMGLGPIMAIYQARFLSYLHNRELADTAKRKVWAFLGDGETDEPESLGAISLAGRENLDNLIFVVNCNLQRLDGPVRGNGKIIQELEGVFRGAGWNVIKVIWGSYWDPLLARDTKGLLRKRMDEALDGEYQNYKAKGGAYTREHFFGKYPELKDMVSNLSDEDIWRLNRGGHDPHKTYAAYAAAMAHTGQPTVILIKTVKGYGMGEAGEAQNVVHQTKKMDDESIRVFRDRFRIPISDEDLPEVPFYRPADDSPEIKYLKERREKLGGAFPIRHSNAESLQAPELKVFEPIMKSSGKREISTTMAFVRVLSIILRDKQMGPRVVPIVADEARTFGMEGMFRQLGIYSSIGQLYEPMDADQMLYYREDKKGQILQEGITEAGAMSSWIAAATSYANSNLQMVPFYIFYSMFGFQRIGDLAYAAADMRARGFLLGGTAGRTTLNGEGLQHEDGHSHLLAATNPNCIAYDPTFAFEVAVIIQDGLRRMYQEQEDCFYYVTVMNENYQQPAMPKGAEEGIRKGLYLFSKAASGKSKASAQLMGCGTILREVIAAADMLKQDFDVACDIWSATSFNELAREAADIHRSNRLNPGRKAKQSHVEKCLAGQPGPVIAASDYMRAFANQIREYVPQSFTTLGTDGFGRSDTRAKLREFFEVDRNHIAYTTVYTLVQEGTLPGKAAADAMKKYGIDPKKPNPATV